MALYGLLSGPVSLMGSNWRKPTPLAAAQSHIWRRAAVSPMPRSSSRRKAKAGTSTPAARRFGWSGDGVMAVILAGTVATCKRQTPPPARNKMASL